MKMLLPDINVWLALTFQSHSHHESAKSWFDNVSDDTTCVFCRMTQQGFLRLATNPSVFGDEAVSLETAWTLYDAFFADTRVAFAHEPTNLELTWRDYTQRRTFSPKVWNDAYLASFAVTSDTQLVTFDRGFSQYSDVSCTILS